MNKVTLCIPTLNQYNYLVKCIESSLNGRVQPDKISIIDNGYALPIYNRTLIEDMCRINGKELAIQYPHFNLGVAKSWNWFFQHEQHPMLISNDDLEFSERDIENFELAYDNNKSDLFYPANINHLNMFSCFMPTKHLIDTVGLFDENFYPAYFEDNDFYYRMTLNNMTIESVPTRILHHGSATIAAFDSDRKRQHHENFRKNWLYYQQKWGGLPHEETFRTPFGK